MLPQYPDVYLIFSKLGSKQQDILKIQIGFKITVILKKDKLEGYKEKIL